MSIRRTLVAVLTLGVLASGGCARPADGQALTVVELFTSQGCSDCPPANANLNVLADRRDILALSFGVTYWDQLGWKDTFASPRFTARQWDYAHAFGRGNVYTPQTVVNGAVDAPGGRAGQMEGLILRAPRLEGPTLKVAGGHVLIGTGAPGGRPAQVWLVRYDPRVVQVPVAAGENTGRTLPHRNVVRELAQIGTWSGRPLDLTLPASGAHGLSSAILLQAGPGGRILSAAKVETP